MDPLLGAWHARVSDSRSPLSGRKLGRVVGERDDTEALPSSVEQARRAGSLDLDSRADPSDAGGAKVIKRIEQRFLAVVECVVVSERDAVHTEVHEQLDGTRRRAEEERLLWRWPAAIA